MLINGNKKNRIQIKICNSVYFLYSLVAKSKIDTWTLLFDASSSSLESLFDESSSLDTSLNFPRFWTLDLFSISSGDILEEIESNTSSRRELIFKLRSRFLLTIPKHPTGEI